VFTYIATILAGIVVSVSDCMQLTTVMFILWQCSFLCGIRALSWDNVAGWNQRSRISRAERRASVCRWLWQ